MSASEVEEQTHTNTPRAGHTLSAGGGESAAARCPAHPPARHRLPSTGIRAPGLWRSSVGAREGEPSRVGPLLRQLPTTTPQRLFFPAICALRKHSRVPGRDACYLGQPGTWACACPCPALGLRVSGPDWEQVGGRALGRNPSLGGRLRAAAGSPWGGSCGPLFSGRMAHWPDLIKPPSDLRQRGWGVRAVTPVPPSPRCVAQKSA